MAKKPQRHHYETSLDANLISLAFSVLVFGLVMFYFVVLHDRPFDLPFSERAFAIASVFLIGFSYLLGPLARFSKFFASKLQYRKPFGLYGYAFAITHILLALLVASPDVLAENGLSLFFGMIAIVIFSFVAATSMVSSIEAFGFDRWQKIQRMGYFAFLLVIIHFVVLENGAFINRQLGQATLVFAGLVVLARVVTLLFKKSR